MIVVDTNVVVPFLHPGEATGEVESLFQKDSQWAAPLVWRSELRNVLWLLVRHRGVPLEEAIRMVRKAEDLMGERESPVDSAQVLEVATESNCSPYDCEFVVLARRLGVRLITYDKPLLKAFPGLALTPREFLRR